MSRSKVTHQILAGGWEWVGKHKSREHCPLRRQMSGMRQLVYEVVCMGGSTDITSEMKVWHSDVHKVQTVIIASSLLPSSSNTFNASSIKQLYKNMPLSSALPVAFEI